MEYPSEIQNIISKRSEWINQKGFLKYKNILENIPDLKGDFLELENGEVGLKLNNKINTLEFQKIEELGKALIPWRKGPFNLFGLEIDSEWRSNLKWDRLKDHLPNLEGKKILDIGTNNGYYMFKMAAQNPKFVLGIDPIIHNYTQFNFIQRFARIPSLQFELLGIEHLKYFQEFFDLIFSMGIIYHHKNPIQQLLDIRNALKPGGQVILESIGIPGDGPLALFPNGSYAKMKNIWFIPTLSCMINWAHKAKFKEIKVVSSSPLTTDEQRITPWCPRPHQSLEDFLNPEDESKTIEGYPAPMRFCLSLKK